MRALYIGRFQPFHFGHLEVIRNILIENDELIIAIGSAQESHTKKNPFTAGERFEIIRANLVHEKFDLSKIYIVPVEDLNRNSLWVAHVRSMVPRFDKIYSNEPLVKILFNDAGYSVVNTPLFSRSEYSSTKVRETILNGGDWEKLVPVATRDYILRVNGVDRIVHINSSDKC
ncbi:MAG: nicotinamide-nucleotide adenylyltransferase [Candidatus Methanofastidiosa archaeon]|nr:nicotinamide-nucleotide adenylyltransferase [Candidatus Methanofastidiosa archaeon]